MLDAECGDGPAAARSADTVLLLQKH